MSDTDELPPLSWEVIARMTREEYEARRSEIQEWLSPHSSTVRESDWRDAPDTFGKWHVFVHWLAKTARRV